MRLSFLLVLLLTISTALAENLVIYPFNSQDALLGVAVADQLSQAFNEDLEVIGPDVAPGLSAPIMVEGGFFSLLRLASSIDSQAGSSLLQSLLGADNVLTGRISFVDNQLEATYFLAKPEGVIEFRVRAPENNPSELVARSLGRLVAHLGEERNSDFIASIDLSSPYENYVRAVALVGFGDIEQASAVLEEALTADNAGLEPRLRSLFDDVQAVRVGGEGSSAARMAVMSLSNTPIDEALSVSYFESFAAQSSLKVADVWRATLLASQDDELAANAFAANAQSYPFAQAAQVAYQRTNQEEPAYQALAESNDFATLLTGALLAQASEDNLSEKVFLSQLQDLEPSFVYPYERLSFIAFDEDDALAAGEALVVATQLEPENELYWTNLGWAYYLLGVLDKSETASIRAVTLDPGQNIAFFNLGLAQVVTGRLEEAMRAYAEAIALDPEVDDEAVLDLVNALDLYPDQVSIHYALATLYEQEGQRESAADQFELYLERAGDTGFTRFAQQRLDVLRAPPAAIEISSGVKLGLGEDLLEAQSFQLGDRLSTSFELYTPGAELPNDVTVSATLKDSEGNSVADSSQNVSIPRNAIGYIIDSVSIDIPSSLNAGNYTLELTANASEDRQTSTTLELNLEGRANLLRQLISRDLILEDLETASPFYTQDDLGKPDSFIVDQLMNELKLTADAADEALPVIDQGRFEGLSGGELFTSSTETDITDFLTFLLDGGSGSANISFVDFYAQWALEGAEVVSD